MNCRSTTVLLLVPMWLLMARSGATQPVTNPLIDAGLQQLATARATRSDAALQQAEATFEKARAADPDNPQVLVHAGEVKFSRAGVLAAQGQLGPAGAMIQSAMADMNRAIALAPAQLDIRLTRGLSYAAFPAFYNLTATARDDLETAMRDSHFAELALDVRNRIAAALERLKPASSRPDRFPNLPPETSPVIAAASIVTFANARPGVKPDWLEWMTKGVEGAQGMLGVHTVTSVDHPGMFIMFTWWKNKQALNDFYYSEIHQGWMNMRGQSSTGQRTAVSPDEIPSQLAIEVFAGVNGGIRINGGLIPSGVIGTK